MWHGADERGDCVGVGEQRLVGALGGACLACVAREARVLDTQTVDRRVEHAGELGREGESGTSR